MAVQDIMIVKFKEMESNGKLERVESCPWVSKMVIVPKPNADIRICIAHREVKKRNNSRQVRNVYPEELLKFCEINRFSGKFI